MSRIPTDSEATDAPYSNVLVVTLFKTRDVRRTVEKVLVQELAARGVVATRMTALETGDAVPDRDAVIRQVEKLDADAVLVTQLVSYDNSAKRKDRSPQGSYKFYSTPYVNVYGVEQTEYIEPPTFELTFDVALRTDLYSVASRESVWAIATERHFKRDIEDRWDNTEVIDEAQTIVGTLAQDRLIGRR